MAPRSAHARTATALAVALVAIGLGVAIGRAQSSTYPMQAGETLAVQCTSGLSGTIGAQAAQLVCATLIPTATVTATVAPTHTHTPSGGTGVCGESMAVWHAPVINGCATLHEHGDAPPAWIAAAGYTVSFDGPFATSPMENTMKHMGHKGFSIRLKGVDIYYRIHAMSNVLDRAARFHSYEVWARDGAGAVSHWQGWNDFGDPVTARIPRNGPGGSTRPVMLVVDQSSFSDGITCEQWYPDTAGWTWNIGWTICGVNSLFYPGENAQQAQSSWRLPNGTGDPGGRRRAELSWAPREDTPRGTFWATQFGDRASGPTAAICSQSSTYSGVTYPHVCLQQTIAPSMSPVVFPGNSAEKTFDTTGVRIPN